jgi:hypothetical protein
MKAENCIFTLDINKPDETTIVDKNSEYYTILGSHDFIDNNNRPQIKTENKNVMAKCTTKNNSKKYYVKVGAYGRIFNPMGMFSEGNNEKFVAKTGKKQFEFKEVNQKIFDLYLNFLSTKNLAWLNNAEREMI